MEDINIHTEAARAFLDAHRKMVLTVLDEAGHPNSSLMLYAADNNFNIYFGTRASFGKYKALMADNHVAVAVVEESLDPLRVVDIQGMAEQIPNTALADTLEWFSRKNPAKYYVKDAEDFVMFRIVPTGIRWLDASSGDLQMYNLREQI